MHFQLTRNNKSIGGLNVLFIWLSMFVYTFILSVVSSSPVKAQHWVVSGIAESTMNGIQYGAASGLLWQKGFMVEVFYQQGYTRLDEWPETKNTLYGLQTIIPLAKSNKMNFSVFTRSGFANDHYFVCIPGLETTIHLNKYFGLAAGFSWRFGHPAIHSRLLIKI